jgi:MOSC domain-containing protein YiiM
MGKVLAVCISEKKGTGKTNINEVELIENFGLKGDAHAGNWHRQVSLLSYEKIEEFKEAGGKVELGAFGENIVVQGIDLAALPVGTMLHISEVVLEVTQIGKECHNRCNIYYSVGDCIMPREGIFARVVKGGKIKINDKANIKTADNY